MDINTVKPFTKEGRIVWTMTTSGYVRYTMNLVRWLEVAKVPWTLCVVCCDDDCEKIFRRQKIPCVSWRGDKVRRPQAGMAAFGTPSFEKCNQQKLAILEWFAKNYAACGIEYSLYLDGDIIVQKDPWPLLQFTENILFQCDCFNPDDHEDGVGCECICSGVIATRHTSVEQAGLYTFEAELWESVSKQDQPFIASRLISTGTPYKILNRRQFGNGAWQKSGKWRDNNWCLIHYNYYVSGTKRTAMKQENHWLE